MHFSVLGTAMWREVLSGQPASNSRSWECKALDLWPKGEVLWGSGWVSGRFLGTQESVGATPKDISEAMQWLCGLWLVCVHELKIHPLG